MYINQFVTVM